MSSDRVLATPRLWLRRLRDQDRTEVARMNWLDTQRVMERSLRADGPYGFLAVVLREGGHFCGLCGLLKQRLAHGMEIEVAYHLLPSYHGRGIATDAAAGVMDYAFGRLGHDRVVSLIRHDNAASRRVAEKNGLSHERDLVFHGSLHGMYVIQRDRKETV